MKSKMYNPKSIILKKNLYFKEKPIHETYPYHIIIILIIVT